MIKFVEVFKGMLTLSLFRSRVDSHYCEIAVCGPVNFIVRELTLYTVIIVNFRFCRSLNVAYDNRYKYDYPRLIEILLVLLSFV